MAPRAETHHARWLGKLAQETGRERMRRARAAVAQARKDQRDAGKRARQACERARVSARASIAKARADLKVRIADLRAELRFAIDEKRGKVRACCGADRAAVRAHHDAILSGHREALEGLKRDLAIERTWKTTTTRASRAQATRELSAHELAELEGELSADELIVWRKVGRRIRVEKGARWSRLEAFRHWLAEHQADVDQILAQAAEQELQRAIRAEAEERKQLAAMRKALRKREPKALRAYVSDSLADVPF